jgi:membrane protein
VYLVSAPKRATRMSRFPGAFAAAFILVVTSMIYSQMITVSLRYEILYGSLASFVIVMIWLYTCSLILIMANVLNISISKIKEVRESERLLKTGVDGCAP